MSTHIRNSVTAYDILNNKPSDQFYNFNVALKQAENPVDLKQLEIAAIKKNRRIRILSIVAVIFTFGILNGPFRNRISDQEVTNRITTLGKHVEWYKTNLKAKQDPIDEIDKKLEVNETELKALDSSNEDRQVIIKKMNAIMNEHNELLKQKTLLERELHEFRRGFSYGAKPLEFNS